MTVLTQYKITKDNRKIEFSHNPYKKVRTSTFWGGPRLVTRLRAYIEFTRGSVSPGLEFATRILDSFIQFASDRRVIWTRSVRYFPATLPPSRYPKCCKNLKIVMFCATMTSFSVNFMWYSRLQCHYCVFWEVVKLFYVTRIYKLTGV